MKKYGKGVALALVFVLAFSLFAALGLYGGSASKVTLTQAKDANEYLVLEIVPEASMASLSASDINVPSGKTANIKVCTPTSLEGDDFSLISEADLFVINQNGAKGSTSFLSSGKDISWKVAYEIFKKVAGVNTESARFIIDKTVYTKATTNNITNPEFFVGTDGVNGMSSAWGNEASYLKMKVMNSASGYSKNITKLYIMLEVMDPATFYGLFFNQHRESYYVDYQTGDFLSYGLDMSNNVQMMEPAYRYSSWFPKMFVPFFALNSASYSNLYTDMGIDVGDQWSDNSSDLTHTDSNKKRGYAFNGESTTVRQAVTAYNGKSYTNITNNGHTYRVLVVSPNYSAGKGAELAYSILKDAYSSNQGLLGGIKITTLSMYQFAGDTDKIKDKYDAIYFEDGSDSQANDLRNGKLYGDYNSSKTFTAYRLGNSTSVHYDGLDLTDKKLEQLKAFDKIIIVSNSLKDKKGNWGSSNIKDYFDSFTASGNKYIDKNNFTGLKAKIDSLNTPNMVVISQPITYASDTDFDWYCQDGGANNTSDSWQDYLTVINSLDADQRYLSPEDGVYKLKFTYKVDSSATIKLYVDTNNDGRFEGDVKQTESVSAGTHDFEFTLPSYSGGYYWKFEASGSGGSTYITGISAIKASGKRTINILQVIPVDENGNKWGSSDDVAATNILLPMKSEIAAAKAANRVNGTTTKRGNITQYNINPGSNTRLNIDTYFEGVMRVQVKNQPVDFTHSTYDLVRYSNNGQISEAAWANSGESIQSSPNTGRAKALILNASLFYYFLEKTGGYDLNVLRISTDEFSARLNLSDESPDSAYKITQDPTTGALYYMDPTSSVTDPKIVGCDLLMIGCSNRFVNSGYNDTTVINTISDYVSKGQHVYVGGGVIQPAGDRLSDALLNSLGFNRHGAGSVENYTHAVSNGQVRNNGGVGVAVKTNEGTMASYPYIIPSNLRIANSSSSSPVYQLDLDKNSDISVFFASCGLDAGRKAGYNGLGDVINNYYLYKRGNITFTAIGQNHGQVFGQKAVGIKIPEAALLVNAIASSSDPGNNDPTPSKYTVNFVDKATNTVIDSAIVNGVLTVNSTSAKLIEANIPTGYAWNKSTDPIQVKKKNNASAPTAVITEDTVSAGKLSFKFADTEGFKGEYIITVPVARPDVEIKQRFVGDGPAKNSIIKTETSVLNANEKTKTLSVTLLNDSLELKDSHIDNDSIAESRYSGSTVTSSGTNVTIELKDNGAGFEGHYEIILDVDGPYTPDYAAYQIVVVDKNGAVINDAAASGTLTYNSTSSQTLDTITYNADAYNYVRVEASKGTVTATHSSGSVTPTLRDSSGFKQDYVVYVVLELIVAEQPPVPTLKVKNPDKTETVEGTDTNNDGIPDEGPIDKVPTDPDDNPSFGDPTNPGITYVKYTDYLYPDYETKDNGIEKEELLAVNEYLYYKDITGVGNVPVMKVVFDITMETPSVITVQVGSGANRATINLPVYDSHGNVVGGNKINSTGNGYYIEVPITNAYYEKQAALDPSHWVGIDENDFGMDVKDGFKVTLIATPEGGRYGVKTDLCFVKRGMFRID